MSYQQLAITCSINDEDQLAVATQFLHSLGSLIHFPSRHSGLSDLVILKPQFLPNLMCTVVTTKTTLVKSGVLMHKVFIIISIIIIVFIGALLLLLLFLWILMVVMIGSVFGVEEIPA